MPHKVRKLNMGSAKQPIKPVALWIAIVVTVAGIAFAIMQHSKARAQADAQRARYERLQSQRDYTASTFPCSVRFPSGFARRVTSYDPFSYRGHSAEIATSNDDTEGEAWAEFYALPSSTPEQAFTNASFADVTHPLVRTRLAYLFDYAFASQVDVLKDHQQVLSEASLDGWKMRLSYLASPHGVAQVNPRQVPRSKLEPTDIIAELPTYGLASNTNKTLSPWIWIGVDDFRSQSDRDAYRRAERAATEKLRNQQLDFQAAQARFERMHRHFYLVEAAKEVKPHQVVVLRRFGSILSEKTPQNGVEIIQKMVNSVRCS
ncbi:MAG: hypothetical protein U1E84_14950 [Rhodoferax sp.]